MMPVLFQHPKYSGSHSVSTQYSVSFSQSHSVSQYSVGTQSRHPVGLQMIWEFDMMTKSMPTALGRFEIIVQVPQHSH
jgi:hypothetical protein